MNDHLLDSILATTYIQVEALSRLRALKDLILVQLFGSTNQTPPYTFEQGKKQVLDTTSSPQAQHTSWLTTLGPSFFQSFTRENVYQLFGQLETDIKSIKPLVVYLPFEIPNDAFAPIGQYLRKNYGPRFLIETKIDPDLIAGTTLVWEGVIRDYSLKKKIADNREQILTTLKSFVKH